LAVEVIMPKFGLTMHEGTIQKWLKSEGEVVTAGEPLFEVETEKVLYEVEAPASGVLAKILFPASSTVPIRTVIAVIAEPGEEPAEVASRYGARASQAAPPTASASTGEPKADAAIPPRVAGRATPAARKLAEKLGVALGAVSGTGPGGRITREDVERAAERGEGALRTIPFSGMRRTIAERMQRSLHEAAQLTITTEADVTEMVARRRQLPPEITYTDMVTQAVAQALTRHPLLNSRLEQERITILPQINIGIAVAIEEGLLVPVIRKADRKSLPEIAAERARLVEKAKSRTLTAEDLADATFTITNLGNYGIDSFTPIVQMPQVAILGVGRIVAKPRFVDDGILNRKLMTLSLSFDHRVVDGAPAAAFLRTLATLLGGNGSEARERGEEGI